MKKSILIMSVLLFLFSCKTVKVSDEAIAELSGTLDFGDHASVTLVGKAWNAATPLEKLAYTKKCLAMYGEEGKKQNSSLTDFAPADSVHDFWALNDCGTSLFIMAQVYQELEMFPEAIAALKRLGSDYKYSQCWDPKGWFWQPSAGALEKAEELEILKD